MEGGDAPPCTLCPSVAIEYLSPPLCVGVAAAVEEMVECSALGQACATSWSSSLGLSLVYCGRDGKLGSAVSACYSTGEY